MVVPLVIINFSRIFPYKPFIFGSPIYGNPHICVSQEKLDGKKGRLPWLAGPKGGLTPERKGVRTPSSACGDRMNIFLWCMFIKTISTI